MYGFDIHSRLRALLEDTPATVDCYCRGKRGLSDQKVNLSENWVWREVPPPICVPSASAMVWPTRPKLELMAGTPPVTVHPAGVLPDAGDTDVHIPPSGLVKFGWLNMLK